MLDIIHRGKIDFSGLQTVVFDEADEMLNMGFRDELDGILEKTPEDKHTWLFSATMPKEIRTLANRYMHEPQEIVIGSRNEGSANVTHHYYMVNSRQRYLALKRIIDFYPEIYSIIFCRTRRETQEVAEQLIKDGYNADALHGDLSQAQRDNAMSRFRLKNLQLLVATDVAARGLDVTNLTHVLNYNLPDETEQYVHRSGRTGRASATGISIAIITPREKGRLREIQKVLKKDFVLQPIPQGEEICEKQLLYQINRMMQLDMGDGAGPIENYLPGIYEKLQDLSKEEIIKRFVWREFNRFSEYYANAPVVEDLSNPEGKGKQPRGDSKRGQKGVAEGLTRIFVNLGHMDGLKPQNMLGIINDSIGTKEAQIGRIEIYKTCSFVEVDKHFCNDILDGLNHTVWGDRKLFAEPATGKDEKPAGAKRRGREPREERAFEERKPRSSGRRRNEDSFEDRKSEWKVKRSGWQNMVDPDAEDYRQESRGKKKRGYDFSAFDRSVFEEAPAKKRSNSAAGRRARKAIETARETKPGKRRKK